MTVVESLSWWLRFFVVLLHRNLKIENYEEDFRNTGSPSRPSRSRDGCDEL